MNCSFKFKPQIVLILISLGNVDGQDLGNMIIEVIEGNTYVFKDYNERNELKNTEVYKVGQIIRTRNVYILPIIIFSYDETGMLKDSTHTSYKCQHDDQQMLMTILFHAGKNSGSKISIIQTNKTELYPVGIEQPTRLANFSYRLKIEGGFAGVMGASRDILFYERQANPLLSTKYNIIGKMTMKTYAFGITVSTNQYNFTETVDTNKGIIFQKFTKSGGDYFTIEIKNQG